jgi:transcription antitermination factor NusG
MDQENNIDQENTYTPVKWYLLKCIGGNEHNVIKKLNNHSEFLRFFKNNFIVLADYEKEKKSKGPNIFSGYFLSEMEDQPLSRAILRTCGASIVKEYKKAEIEVLLENIKYQTNLTVNKNFQPKELVKVNMGIINGEGTVISINDEKQTAMVEILCFGSYTSVNVPFENIEKIA